MRKREGLEPANEEQSVFQKIVTSRYYDPFMMSVVVTNCVFLAITDPKLSDDEQPQYVQMLSWAFNIAYVLDVALQLQAFGLVRYLLDPWHYLDGIVSAVSAIEIILPIVSLVMKFFGQGTLQLSDTAKSGLNTIRIIRALRPLKAVSFVPSLVAYVEAIFASAETVVMTMGILLIFLTGFGIFTNTVVGDALSYRCYPTNFTQPSVANNVYYLDFNTSYYSSKFNNAFCGHQSARYAPFRCWLLFILPASCLISVHNPPSPPPLSLNTRFQKAPNVLRASLVNFLICTGRLCLPIFHHRGEVSFRACLS